MVHQKIQIHAIYEVMNQEKSTRKTPGNSGPCCEPAQVVIVVNNQKIEIQVGDKKSSTFTSDDDDYSFLSRETLKKRGHSNILCV
jgi:hypothetical protein